MFQGLLVQFLWMTVAVVHNVRADVRMPPRIVVNPTGTEIIFRIGQDLRLSCSAEGVPKPDTVWYKNGITLSSSATNVHYEVGYIELKEMDSFNEGFYQCKASNMYGTALSSVVHLKRAAIGSYSQPTVSEMSGHVEGEPLVIPYQPVKCIPRPSFSWAIAKSETDNSPEAIVLDKRVQIDDDGNLHFSYLVPSDAHDGKLYKCNVLNPHLDLTVGGSYTRLTNIVPVGRITPFAPRKAFSSDPSLIALEGGNITLRCFFSGYPAPSLAWSKQGGSLPIGRYTVTNYNTELTIRNVQKADEGDYLCTASSSASVTIQIDVQAVPTFVSASDHPNAVNVTEGEQVRLTCRATAEPVAGIVWYKNGETLDLSKLPPRMRISKDGTELTIDDVHKDYPDGTTDIQVIQCNASNVHGYAFKDAYINILKKTAIILPPANVHLLYHETSAEFSCEAESDDSTPITIDWFKMPEDMRVYNTSERTVITNGRTSKLMFRVRENHTEEWHKQRGQYRCRATNDYSTDSVNVTLMVDDPPLPPPVTDMESTTEKEEEPLPLAAAGLGDYWWILVIIAIILLILIIIICCCICCRRCKGDTYFVDQKEKKDHRDPEKELADNALQPYRRPDADPLKGSRASLGSSMKGDSDEEGSLNEYGDIDAGKFTEDGSFIGDYATEQRKSHRPGESHA